MSAIAAVPGLGRLRKHHALEHATIAVLFQRRRRVVSVLGRSDLSGFHVYGPFDRQEVELAFGEALERLLAGESHLAITNLCGTNIATTAVLAGSAAILAYGRGAGRSWSRAMAAALLATMAAAPAGRWIQRRLTTDADVTGLALRAIRDYGGAPGGRHLKVYITG